MIFISAEREREGCVVQEVGGGGPKEETWSQNEERWKMSVRMSFRFGSRNEKIPHDRNYLGSTIPTEH